MRKNTNHKKVCTTFALLQEAIDNKITNLAVTVSKQLMKITYQAVAVNTLRHLCNWPNFFSNWPNFFIGLAEKFWTGPGSTAILGSAHHGDGNVSPPITDE